MHRLQYFIKVKAKLLKMIFEIIKTMIRSFAKRFEFNEYTKKTKNCN